MYKNFKMGFGIIISFYPYQLLKKLTLTHPTFPVIYLSNYNIIFIMLRGRDFSDVFEKANISCFQSNKSSDIIFKK